MSNEIKKGSSWSGLSRCSNLFEQIKFEINFCDYHLTKNIITSNKNICQMELKSSSWSDLSSCYNINVQKNAKLFLSIIFLFDQKYCNIHQKYLSNDNKKSSNWSNSN